MSATYRHRGARFRREIYASHPDDVIVIRLTGGGGHTGVISLEGTQGNGQLRPGLRLAIAVLVAAQGRRKGLLLPALPKAWSAKGSVTGIGARGGFTVDYSWRDGKATTVTVRSVGGTETELRAGKVRRKISLKPGASVKIDLS